MIDSSPRDETTGSFITVVSGLPRSGTSMMMKMLDLGGMPLLVDDIRKPDEDNPRGYYEYEKVKKLDTDNSWLNAARGKVIKIVSPLLYHLQLDTGLRYRIIFMLREIDEILSSQRKMADRLKQGGDAIDDGTLRQNYSRHLEEIKSWLAEKKNIDVMYIDYRDVIDNPRETALRVSGFLGGGFNADDMASAVDTSLYRQRVDAPSPAGAADTDEKSEEEIIAERLKNLGYM